MRFDYTWYDASCRSVVQRQRSRARMSEGCFVVMGCGPVTRIGHYSRAVPTSTHFSSNERTCLTLHGFLPCECVAVTAVYQVCTFRHGERVCTVQALCTEHKAKPTLLLPRAAWEFFVLALAQQRSYSSSSLLVLSVRYGALVTNECEGHLKSTRRMYSSSTTAAV